MRLYIYIYIYIESDFYGILPDFCSHQITPMVMMVFFIQAAENGRAIFAFQVGIPSHGRFMALGFPHYCQKKITFFFIMGCHALNPSDIHSLMAKSLSWVEKLYNSTQWDYMSLCIFLWRGLFMGIRPTPQGIPPKRVYFCRTNDHLEGFINHAEVSYGGNWMKTRSTAAQRLKRESHSRYHLSSSIGWFQQVYIALNYSIVF